MNKKTMPQRHGPWQNICRALAVDAGPQAAIQIALRAGIGPRVRLSEALYVGEIRRSRGKTGYGYAGKSVCTIAQQLKIWAPLVPGIQDGNHQHKQHHNNAGDDENFPYAKTRDAAAMVFLL